LRGKTKVNAQYPKHSLQSRGRPWLMYCMVHNIEKIQRYGQMA
jgi:hypothetical protein